MPPKHLSQHLLQAYREWLSEQPCHTPVETMENHFSRFWDWYVRQYGEPSSTENAAAA